MGPLHGRLRMTGPGARPAAGANAVICKLRRVRNGF